MSSAGMTALRTSGKRAGSALISSTVWWDRAISRGFRKIGDLVGWSSIDIPQHRVGGSDHGDHVCHHMAKRHVLDRLQIHERGGAELHAARLVRTIGDDV